jgi:crotonobetainyl-CoA:carnitine CoA-transferase CaiB-like acyl-CoA transferase
MLGTHTLVYGRNRHYGAEVIKVEPPNIGDPLRVWRELDVDGVSPWWRSIGRNKKSVTIDLRQEEGREYVNAAHHTIFVS